MLFVRVCVSRVYEIKNVFISESVRQPKMYIELINTDCWLQTKPIYLSGQSFDSSPVSVR